MARADGRMFASDCRRDSTSSHSGNGYRRRHFSCRSAVMTTFPSQCSSTTWRKRAGSAMRPLASSVTELLPRNMVMNERRLPANTHRIPYIPYWPTFSHFLLHESPTINGSRKGVKYKSTGHAEVRREPSAGEASPTADAQRKWWGPSRRWQRTRMGVEPADKPGSVVGSHSSGTTVTGRL